MLTEHIRAALHEARNRDMGIWRCVRARTVPIPNPYGGGGLDWTLVKRVLAQAGIDPKIRSSGNLWNHCFSDRR